MGFLKGKTAIVTGGTRGIGLAIAKALLGEGASVAICGRSQEALDEALAELKAIGPAVGLAVDVADRESVAKLFSMTVESFGGLDILINNAGVGIFKPMGQFSVEDWRMMMETNLTGVFHCCQLALPLMTARGGGAMIQIGSLAGKNPFAGGSIYNATKFGLNGFAEAMMLDHRYDGIRVSNVCPGSVDTQFSPGTARAPWKVQPEDIAEIILTVLRLPARTMMSYVEVRPTAPAKK
jgi:NADP-dependent 3-hydroxy acid dehydrogenase YdfG